MHCHCVLLEPKDKQVLLIVQFSFCNIYLLTSMSRPERPEAQTAIPCPAETPEIIENSKKCSQQYKYLPNK